MKVYRVKGKFRMGRKRGQRQRFAKEVIADNKEDAVEKIYSVLGSKHRVQRTNVKIYETEEVPPEEAEDFVVKDRISMEE
ncbi:MAG: 50S ribosomal protein L18Ae [Thermoplasmata archaeon]